MTTTMSTPTTHDLPAARATLADLQHAHAACDATYAAALDTGDANEMVAARHRKADLEDEIKAARVLLARQEVIAADAELAAAREAATVSDGAMKVALDARDAAYAAFTAAAEAAGGPMFEQQFAQNRIEAAQRALVSARQRLAQLVAPPVARD